MTDGHRVRARWRGAAQAARARRAVLFWCALVVAAVACGCGTERPEPRETFHWVSQPIAFSPPPGRWEREGDNGGGMLGVRFVLRGGGGQCISVLAYRQLAERDRTAALRRLIARRDSLEQREMYRELSLARPATDDPISDREVEMARRVNAAIDRAMSDEASDRESFVASDLEDALSAASAYQPTLEELLPRIRLSPERMQEPDRWRIFRERDTTLAGEPAYASDDTLITPERPLLYREIYWVVNGCAFKAVYQGTPQELRNFTRLVDSITFPADARVASH